METRLSPTPEASAAKTSPRLDPVAFVAAYDPDVAALRAECALVTDGILTRGRLDEALEFILSQGLVAFVRTYASPIEKDSLTEGTTTASTDAWPERYFARIILPHLRAERAVSTEHDNAFQFVWLSSLAELLGRHGKTESLRRLLVQRARVKDAIVARRAMENSEY